MAHRGTALRRFRGRQQSVPVPEKFGPEKVLVSVWEKFGTGNFPGIWYWYRRIPRNFLLFGWYRYRYGKKLVSEKKYQYRYWKNKKLFSKEVPVPEKFGPGKKYRYWKTFWVPSHSGRQCHRLPICFLTSDLTNSETVAVTL